MTYPPPLPPPGLELAATGASSAGPLLQIGLLLVGLGAILVVAVRRQT